MANKSADSFLNSMKYLISLLMAAAIILSMNMAYAQDSKTKKDWEFLIEPYLLFANIKGDTTLRGLPEVDIDVSTSDIFDHLNIGGNVRMETLHKNNWGLAFDFGFMDLEVDDVQGPLVTWATGVKQTIMELILFKRTKIEAGSVDVFLGARRWKNKIEVIRNAGNFVPRISRQRDENWTDAIIGVRGIFDIAKDWQLMARGDVGGLGLESDFTAKTVVGVMYNITDSIILDIQYVGLWVDYETGTRNTSSYFAYDTVTHGPAVGVIFNF